MLRRLAALCALAEPALGLRRADLSADRSAFSGSPAQPSSSSVVAYREEDERIPTDGKAGPVPPAPPGFRLLKVGELVPHNMVDAHHQKAAGTKDVAKALELCQGNPKCVGVQSQRRWGIRTREMSGGHFAQGSCLSNYRDISIDRGFQDIPMVPLEESDGTIYMRDDCLDDTVDPSLNSYWGVPWNWTQNGHALINEAGLGVSPLLDLLTPSVVEDIIGSGVPPWQYPKDIPQDKVKLHADVSCRGGDNYKEVMEALRAKNARGQDGGALLADIGQCICHMISNGWDPEQDLRSDVVLLLNRDENFSPGTRLTDTATYSHLLTNLPCVVMHGKTSIFKTDVDAFTALAENPRVLGMYFIQTPPITHEKVWVTPLGLDTIHYLPFLLNFVEPGAPERQQQRTALYDVSHNLAVDYRRAVFQAVQDNFGKEQLHVRYVPWGLGSRIKDVAKETVGAVFGQSPIGIGENCFRHMELLAAGTIPVVQASIGIAALRYLPHLAVSNWHEVTPELLRKSYREIWDRVKRGEFSFEPLTRGFWVNHILDTAHRREIPEFYAKFPNPEVTCDDWNCVEPTEWNPPYHALKPKGKNRSRHPSPYQQIFLGKQPEWIKMQQAAHELRAAKRREIPSK